MFSVGLDRRGGGPYTVLCLGAHPDDIEIGCGGTLLTLLERYPDTVWHWVVFSGQGDRQREAYDGAAAFLGRATAGHVVVKNFRDGFFPRIDAVKEYFEELKRAASPDVIFTHYRADLHQDHRTISELTWNTFRRHLILEYEVPKYDGDFGAPNVFVPLEEAVARDKVERILKVFGSQRERHWFAEETFLSVLRLRGMECRARYAEAFYGRKVVLA
jgi:LmbE family N-acetylglucosaminyl deacetylase